MNIFTQLKKAREFNAGLAKWQRQLEDRLTPDCEVQAIITENLRLRESLSNLINPIR